MAKKKKNTSWKTTLAGAVVGLIPLLNGIAQGTAQGQSFDWTQIGLGAGIITLGALMKDADKTGLPIKPVEDPKEE